MGRVRQELLRALLLTLGVLCAGMGLKGFLLSSNFIDGGVTGASMLLAKLTGVHVALLLPLVNLPFVIVGYQQMGRELALRSVVGIGALALVVALVPFPDVTPDLVLTAVFGGLFLGAGIGLAIRSGAVLDGTEIAALLISRKSGALRVGDVILVSNVVLFLAAMAVLGVEPALYSILTYFAAAKTLDFVLHGLDEYTAMTIISDAHEAIRVRITGELGRGVTVYRGYGGVSGEDRDILYCVVTRLEISRVRAMAYEADASAFVVYHPLTGAEGGVLKPAAPALASAARGAKPRAGDPAGDGVE